MGYYTSNFNAGPPLRRATTFPTTMIDSSSRCVETKKRQRYSLNATTEIPAVEDEVFKPSNTSGERRGGRFRGSNIRKTRVAITGGTMVGVGLVMIPLPIPMGAVVAGAGLSYLSTEFPAAQRILDNTRGAIEGSLLKSTQPQLEDQKDEEESLYGSDSVIFSTFEDSAVFDTDSYADEDVYVSVWAA